MKSRYIALGLVACAFSGNARAQSDGMLAGRPVVNESVSAGEAVAIALRESPVLRGATAEVEAAAARVAAARAESRPMASANGFLTGGSNPAILPSSPLAQPQVFMGVPRDTFADLNLMLMVPLYAGGRFQAMVRAASAMRDASEADRAAMRQEVAQMTRAAHHAVLARREMLRVWTDRLSADEERLRLDRARLAQEQIPAYYVQRGEAEVAATRQELVNAERDVEVALAQLKTIMGVHPSSQVQAEGILAEPDVQALQPAGAAAEASGVPPFEEMLRRAERDRPEVAAAERRMRGAGAEADSVRGQYRPQVNAMAMGDLMNMEGEGTRGGATFGVVASIPLFTGGMRRARVAEAEAERRRMEQERERVALRIAEEVQTARLNLRAARQNVETARTALAAARAEYEAASLRYQVGRSVAVEALDALASRTRAESNLVQALYTLNVAYDETLRAIGALDIEADASARKG